MEKMTQLWLVHWERMTGKAHQSSNLRPGIDHEVCSTPLEVEGRVLSHGVAFPLGGHEACQTLGAHHLAACPCLHSQ